MRFLKNMICVGVFGAIAVLAIPTSSEAVCYRCSSRQKCVDACRNSGGNVQCSFRTYCDTRGTCVSYDCELEGNSCTGTSTTGECGSSCSPAIDECTFDYIGASLVIPHGQTPADDGWLGPKQRAIAACGTSDMRRPLNGSNFAIEPPARAETSAEG